METHSVPQHIQSYQFHLVGDMTLKQFVELACGLVLALVFYSSPLYWFLKWPLLVMCVLGGVAFAFVPIEERPLEIWVVAFFKAIYAPTQYLWKKSNPPPDILTAQVVSKPLPAVEIISPQGKEKLQEYLNTLPQTQPASVVDDNHQRLQDITNLFQTTNLPASAPASAAVAPQIPEQSPVSVHPLTPPSELPPLPPLEDKIVEPVSPVIPPDVSQTVFTAPQVATPSKPATKSATFSLDIPIPITPSSPNLVVGMVLTNEGKIVENAILEIRDSATGHPVRAMKTNKIGQFSIITPLKPGNYDIVTEKDFLDFDSVKFEAKNEIIPPIEIRSKPSAVVAGV
jgi:hypothetical protein